jgi:prepilin-type N-terminal cleavage/methylation domain-containing protein
MSITSGRKAFTLVEIMVALTLISMIFAGVFGILRQSLFLTESARDYTRVAQILQSEIELMRSMNWTDLSAVPYWSKFEPQGTFVAAYKDRYTCYKWVLNRNADQKEILLVCLWTDGRNKTLYKTYRTLFTRRGLNDYYYRAL